MEYRYIAGFVVEGVSLQAPEELVLLDRLDIRTKIVLTSRPDAYLSPTDTALARVPLSSEPKRTLSLFLNGIGRDSPSVT
jgi:hypothetical protein